MELNKLSYEEAMSKLEGILEELENDNITLNDSLNKYRQGMELYNYCSDILKKAEGEIKIILEERDTIREIDFVREGEDEYC
jgi:exodeoxyribonuclease VII small subunit